MPLSEKDQHRLRAIGNRLKMLRESIELDGKRPSQEAFANAIGMETKQYWRLETGSEFKMSTLFRVLEFQKMTLSEFFKDLK